MSLTVGFAEEMRRSSCHITIATRHPSYTKLLVPIIYIRGRAHTYDVRLERRWQLYCDVKTTTRGLLYRFIRLRNWCEKPINTSTKNCQIWYILKINMRSWKH